MGLLSKATFYDTLLAALHIALHEQILTAENYVTVVSQTRKKRNTCSTHSRERSKFKLDIRTAKSINQLFYDIGDGNKETKVTLLASCSDTDIGR